MLDDDCSFSPTYPALLQKYHHVVFGTTARLLVSINGGKERYAKVYGFRLGLSDLYPNVL